MKLSQRTFCFFRRELDTQCWIAARAFRQLDEIVNLLGTRVTIAHLPGVDHAYLLRELRMSGAGEDSTTGASRLVASFRRARDRVMKAATLPAPRGSGSSAVLRKHYLRLTPQTITCEASAIVRDEIAD